MPPELVDFGSRGGKTYAFIVALLVAATTGEDIHAKPARAGEPGIRLCGNRRSDAAWQHDHRNDARADNSEHDFLHTGDHDVESRLWHRENRKPQQRHGVAGQHEHVAARRAVDQREIQTNADPQRDCEAEQFRRIDEVGDQDDRPCRADQCSQNAIDGF